MFILSPLDLPAKLITTLLSLSRYSSRAYVVTYVSVDGSSMPGPTLPCRKLCGPSGSLGPFVCGKMSG